MKIHFVLAVLFYMYVVIYAHKKKDHKKKDHHKRDDDNEECQLPEPCEVSLPHEATPECTAIRKADIARARMWYKITDEKSTTRTTPFPVKRIPWLNQSPASVSFNTLTDPFESRWIGAFLGFKNAMDSFKQVLSNGFKSLPFKSYQEYQLVHNSFNGAIKSLHKAEFDNPAMHPEFTDAISNNAWLTDDSFVQRRLAASCPFMLRKVTEDGDVGIGYADLLLQLNPDVDFNTLLSDALGPDEEITMEEAVSEGKLFVLYHEEHNGLASVEDRLDYNREDDRKMMKVTSPITLFILNERVLKVAAIQWDYTPESPVYSPKQSDTMSWAKAKAMVELSDMDICQAVYHLSDIHFSTSIFCLTYRRHFSSKHVLYDLMKFHCEGTTPHISLSYQALSEPESAGHLLFTMGHDGFLKLAQKAYDEHFYGKLDYHELLESRGLDNDTMDIEYYPFREDGSTIYAEIKDFAESFVDMYYHEDSDVINDPALTSFANEVSADGTGEEGGKGKYKGFPAKFNDRAEVATFIVQFVWSIVVHATVNYPTTPYVTFVPMTPTKLYNDPNVVSMAHHMPDAAVTIGIAAFGSTLGNFRVNRLMDYYDKVQDEKLRGLVSKTYQKFQTCTQKTLEERNAERKKKGQLGMQYLEPKWMTNSVHI